MKKTMLYVLLVSIFIGCTQPGSQNGSLPLAQAPPESVGMSSERLSRIDTMLQHAVEKGDIPGAVALVARNGKIVYHKAFGFAENESGRQMKTDDIFRIASMTKAITATAVMILWEEGKFSLDDPISRFIPEFKNTGILKSFNPKDSSFTTEPVKNEITIRHLLTHTSGVGYGFIDGDDRFRMIYQKAGIIDAFTTDKITIGENVKKLGRLPVHHNPGEKFTYGEGLDILGYLIEIVSGMPFDKFLRTRLFEPLGMNDTWFYLPDEKASRLVPVQEPGDGSWTRFKSLPFDPDYPVKGAKSFFAGGAGLSSTAKDYATFLQMYLNGGEYNGRRILSRTTIQAVMGNQFHNVWGDDAESYNGLVFGVLTERGAAKGGHGSAGTFNWGGYFNTAYFADPAEKTIGVIMKQTLNQKSDETEIKFKVLVGQSVAD